MKDNELDDLVTEILDACWIDEEENTFTKMLVRRILLKATRIKSTERNV